MNKIEISFTLTETQAKDLLKTIIPDVQNVSFSHTAGDRGQSTYYSLTVTAKPTAELVAFLESVQRPKLPRTTD